MLHNSKEKQMQAHSPVYNWFSGATSCRHSLSNEPLAGALLLVKRGVSDGAAIRRPAPSGMAPCYGHQPWNFHVHRLLFPFKIQPDFFLKGILSRWSIQILQRSFVVPPSCWPEACPLYMANRYVQTLWSPMFMSEITDVFLGLQS